MSRRAMSPEQRKRQEFHAQDEALSRAILELEIESDEAFKTAAILMAAYQEDSLRIGEQDEDGDNSIDVDEWMHFWPTIFSEFFEDRALMNAVCERIFQIVDWNTNKDGSLKLIHITKFMNRAKKRRNKLGDLDAYVTKVATLTNTSSEPVPVPVSVSVSSDAGGSTDDSARVQALQAQLESERQQRAELESKVVEETGKGEGLADELAAQQGESDALREEIARLKNELESQSTSLSSATLTIASLESQLSSRESSAGDASAAMQSEMESLRVELAEKSQQCSDCRSEAERVKSDFESANLTIESMRVEIESLQKQAAVNSSELDGLRSEVAEKSSELEQCKAQLETQSGNEESLRSELESLRKQVMADESSKGDAAALMVENGRMLDELRHQVDEKSSELAQCHAHGEKLKSDLEEQSVELRDKTSAVEQATSMIEVLTQNDSALRAEIASLKKQLEVDVNESTHSASETDLNAMKTELEMKSQALTKCEGYCEELKTQLQSTSNSMDFATAAIEKMRANERTLREENEALQRQLQSSGENGNQQNQTVVMAEINRTREDLKRQLGALQAELERKTQELYQSQVAEEKSQRQLDILSSELSEKSGVNETRLRERVAQLEDQLAREKSRGMATETVAMTSNSNDDEAGRLKEDVARLERRVEERDAEIERLRSKGRVSSPVLENGSRNNSSNPRRAVLSNKDSSRVESESREGSVSLEISDDANLDDDGDDSPQSCCGLLCCGLRCFCC